MKNISIYTLLIAAVFSFGAEAQGKNGISDIANQDNDSDGNRGSQEGQNQAPQSNDEFAA